MLGAAIRDGKIKSVDDLVTTYIPELKGGAYDGVTLRQVLAMRSGAQWNEDYTDASSDVGQLAASMAENKGASLIAMRSEEHTSELQSLMRISYAVFFLKTKTQAPIQDTPSHLPAQQLHDK